MNVKDLGYNFREGYTDGFNDGLGKKTNAHKMPENLWKTSEKLDLDRLRRVGEDDDSKKLGIEKADYQIERWRLGKTLSDLIPSRMHG
jgi:hypothetical protein